MKKGKDIKSRNFNFMHDLDHMCTEFSIFV